MNETQFRQQALEIAQKFVPLLMAGVPVTIRENVFSERMQEMTRQVRNLNPDLPGKIIDQVCTDTIREVRKIIDNHNAEANKTNPAEDAG